MDFLNVMGNNYLAPNANMLFKYPKHRSNRLGMHITAQGWFTDTEEKQFHVLFENKLW
jgi:hypothetical protein